MSVIIKKNTKTPKEDREYFSILINRLSKLKREKVYIKDTDIYLMEDRGLLKIGMSKDYLTRFRQHKSSNKFAKIVKVYKSDYRLELYLHSKLKDNLIAGELEWFTMYTGIYDDIDSWVEEFTDKFMKSNQVSTTLLKEYPYKMFKFVSTVNKAYAFVVAKNEDRAWKILRKESFIEVKLIDSREISSLTNTLEDLVLGEEYIYKNTLKTRIEYSYCKKRGIDYFYEYGVTIPRKSLEDIRKYLKGYNSKDKQPIMKTSRGNRVARKIKRFYR